MVCHCKGRSQYGSSGGRRAVCGGRRELSASWSSAAVTATPRAASARRGLQQVLEQAVARLCACSACSRAILAPTRASRLDQRGRDAVPPLLWQPSECLIICADRMRAGAEPRDVTERETAGQHGTMRHTDECVLQVLKRLKLSLLNS